MLILKEFRRYTDQNGFIQPTPTGGSGNGLLYTAEGYIAMLMRGEISRDQGAAEITAAVSHVEVEPGRYRRTPEGQGFSDQQEGPDDHIGLAAMSYAFGLPYARRLLDYGQAHFARLSELEKVAVDQVETTDWKWTVPGLRKFFSIFADRVLPYNFNTNSPTVITKDSWLGRFPALIAHLHWAAGETPAWYLRAWWAVQIGIVSPKAAVTDTDAWILSWLLIYVMAGRSTIGRWAARRWFTALNSKFQNGMNDVFRNYFGPDHPTAKYFVSASAEKLAESGVKNG